MSYFTIKTIETDKTDKNEGPQNHIQSGKKATIPLTFPRIAKSVGGGGLYRRGYRQVLTA